jgi:hypothetical protein
MTIDRRAVALLGLWLLLSEATMLLGETKPLAFLIHGLGVLVGMVLLATAANSRPKPRSPRP